MYLFMKNHYYGQGIYRTAKQLIRKIINRRLLKNPYFDKIHHLLACLFYEGIEERIIGYLNPLWIINDIGTEELTVLVKVKNGDMSDFLFSAIYFIQGLNIRYFFISPVESFLLALSRINASLPLSEKTSLMTYFTAPSLETTFL